MNKVPEKATVTQMGWLAKTRAFLEIPNPAMVKVFGISSLATFTSGIALAVEWLFHGRSHTGFEWIIYYALFLICLPLVIWIGLILMAISCSSRRGSSQIVDSVAGKEPCSDVSEAQRNEETERNSCRSLAVVVDSDERKKKKDEKMPRIKRAVSFPSHGKVRFVSTKKINKKLDGA